MLVEVGRLEGDAVSGFGCMNTLLCTPRSALLARQLLSGWGSGAPSSALAPPCFRAILWPCTLDGAASLLHPTNALPDARPPTLPPGQVRRIVEQQANAEDLQRRAAEAAAFL